MAEKEIKPRTYTEQKEAKRYMILTLNCEVLGIWGNLKKLCSDIKANDCKETYNTHWVNYKFVSELKRLFKQARDEYKV